MKKFILLLAVVLMISMGLLTAYAANSVNEAKNKSVDLQLSQIYKKDTVELVLTATKDLTLEELKKLPIAEHNVPTKNFDVYRAEDVTFDKNATIVLTNSDKGFSLVKGSIVRVNSVSNKTDNEANTFSVGYLQEEQYTSTSYGKMANGPITAFEILNDKDSGNYKLFIQQDEPISRTETFDIIITIENP